MDLNSLVKPNFQTLKSKAVKALDNQIDPEHFFEKISFQNLYSDLLEVEVELADLNDIEAIPIISTNSLQSTNTSYVSSLMSSFTGKIQEEVPIKVADLGGGALERGLDVNDSNLAFVRNLLNEDEKRPEVPKKKKVLRLKGYIESFYNQKEEGQRKNVD